jgi:hypothetical protein
VEICKPQGGHGPCQPPCYATERVAREDVTWFDGYVVSPSSLFEWLTLSCQDSKCFKLREFIQTNTISTHNYLSSLILCSHSIWPSTLFNFFVVNVWKEKVVHQMLLIRRKK